MAEENPTNPTPTAADEPAKAAPAAAAPAAAADNSGTLKMLAGFLALSTAGLLAATIVLAVKDDDNSSNMMAPAVEAPAPAPAPNAISEAEIAMKDLYLTGKPWDGDNPCAGKKKEEFDFENIQCIKDGIAQVGEQAGGNVTKGYRGQLGTDVVPITDQYYTKGLCPVNVHWHLGAEHLSVGQYDEAGKGPSEINERRRAAGKARQGFQCSLFDEADEKFTKPYDWKYCTDMEVGQTYEVHWPHSAAGACNTPNQYQSPFYDGVFCGLNMEVFGSLGRQDIANAVGVQAQIFTIVNDDAYYYPDLMRGMIVEGDFGTDMAKYTGSTTGDARNNDDACSQYTPITWQVDRKCHLISASTFDKMCADMLSQRDDMSIDIHPHGSRPLVADELTANNQHDRFLRKN